MLLQFKTLKKNLIYWFAAEKKHFIINTTLTCDAHYFCGYAKHIIFRIFLFIESSKEELSFL